MIHIENQKDTKPKLIPMTDMKQLQVARIVDKSGSYNGVIIMRTASRRQFEIISLSDAGAGQCWTDKTENTLEVELLTEPLTITITND